MHQNVPCGSTKRPLWEPWSSALIEELQSIQGVCLDIDDTLSTAGKLTAEAYTALWGLKKAGMGVIPVTGRPAGWCDHFVRFWPVDAVIAENGALIFYMQDSKVRQLRTVRSSSDQERQDRMRLRDLGKKIQDLFPQAQWASDQNYREYDLAVDICEDVPHWSQEDVQKLLAFCRAEGAHAKLSSIHVNIWFGDYNKWTGIQTWAEHQKGIRPMDLKKWLYIGDSPNDEPMFAEFIYSVGVANLKAYQSQLKHPPRWLTEGHSGLGFVEMATRLIHARETAWGFQVK